LKNPYNKKHDLKKLHRKNEGIRWEEGPLLKNDCLFVDGAVDAIIPITNK